VGLEKHQIYFQGWRIITATQKLPFSEPGRYLTVFLPRTRSAKLHVIKVGGMEDCKRSKDKEPEDAQPYGRLGMPSFLPKPWLPSTLLQQIEAPSVAKADISGSPVGHREGYDDASFLVMVRMIRRASIM
jgi:hypothetical protein